MKVTDILLQTQHIAEDIVSFFEHTKWGKENSYFFKELQEEINTPCVLAVAGEVKVGKSSLINALLGVDLAVTGTTETTATINVFKKGQPISKDTPILCQWIDGRKEWKPRSFLDSLQGTDAETLALSSQIDKLIFYMDDNPLLEDVILVDTPGIGAEVGENGDAHQVQTDAYFHLRQRHQTDTINLSNNADAVLYIFNTNTGPVSTDKEFISALYNNGMGLTALNGIGVLSKIDIALAQMQNIPQFEKQFEKELFKIIPASATLYRYLPTIKQALQLQQKLKEGFPSEQWFNVAIKSEGTFLDETLSNCSLSVTARREMLHSFARHDIAWSTFRLIANELYYTQDIHVSIAKFTQICGIEQLKNIIYNHFFARSRQLRCHRSLSEMKQLLKQILYSDYFLYAKENANKKQKCINACVALPTEYQEMVINLLSTNIEDLTLVQAQQKQLESFIAQIEDLQENLNIVNADYLTYQKLLMNKQYFKEEEITELTVLFTGKQIDVASINNRCCYWSAIANMAIPNSIRQMVAETAKQKYTTIQESTI